MNEDVYGILLKGMPVSVFIGYYLIGLFGIAMFFLTNLYYSIKTDPTTPQVWCWKAFIKGGIRVVLSLISLGFGIIFFEELSPLLFNISCNTIEPVIVEVNGFSAFLMGVTIDRVWQGILHLSYSSVTVMKKQIA